MRTQAPIPHKGQTLAIRQCPYLVEESVALMVAGDSALIRLSCADEHAPGQTPPGILSKGEPDDQNLVR